MKNKRNVFIAFILICCLCLSIGYAALTDTLYVNGTVNLDLDGSGTTDPDAGGEEETPWEEAFDADVYFVDIDAEQAVTKVSADTNGDTDDLLTITVPDDVFTPDNKTATYKVKIKNNSDEYAAKITLNNPAATANFSYVCKWSDDSTNVTLQPGADKEVSVIITLTTNPTADINAEAFNVTFNAEAVAPSA